MTFPFDTLKLKKKLTGIGVPVAHAEAVTEALRDSFEHFFHNDRFISVGVKLLHFKVVMKNDLIKWIVGLSFIQVGLYLGIVLSFHGN